VKSKESCLEQEEKVKKKKKRKEEKTGDMQLYKLDVRGSVHHSTIHK